MADRVVVVGASLGGLRAAEQLRAAGWTGEIVVVGAETVYQWAATTAMRRGDLQRYFRDLNAGTQHITSGPVVLQNCGRWLAGLARDARWEFLDLVSPDTAAGHGH